MSSKPHLVRAALLLALAPAGCGRPPRFEAAPEAAVVGDGREPGPGYWVAVSSDEGETPFIGPEGPGYSRYAAERMAPGATSGADFYTEPPPEVAFMDWLFNEPVTFDIELYMEYLGRMSFAEMVGAVLTSVKIPLGRSTTAALSIGVNAWEGFALPVSASSDAFLAGEEGTDWTKDVADTFDRLESVFVGLDVPLPGRVRARLAVEVYYGWASEADPDAQEFVPATWSLKVLYRAWFW